ncbi:pyruvate/2-oxoglutarate dehydrogenase complex dihydrolipoamide dehydrogenase (E3) component [Marisediminicola sp. UYEF4]|uniref:dihydrolipoyl dehydrogenase family protein n=1 Tax=Marisediminicola sp. UYEF4 TaxID=1756384 RepID=UPI0033918D7C
MGERAEWELVVIGGGSAGLVASRTAASFGAETLLIEGDRLGGDCLWTGCVPSKSLIAAASALTIACNSPHLGVETDAVELDFAAAMRHVHGAMQTIAPVDSPEVLALAGVEVLSGHARFTGARSLAVGGREIKFGQVIIATGGSPAVPKIDGIGSVEVLTSATVWDLTELPERLVVLGGGAIGCEIAQAMARFGSAVTLVHRGDRLLAKEEPRASAIVRAALEADGVTVLTGREATSLSGDGRGLGGAVSLDDGNVLQFDAILAAIGRAPNTGSLDADRAGVELDGAGNVVVTARLRTSNPRIWAAGDVTPLPKFTHTAGVNGSIAASNAVLGLARTIDSAAVPRVTFTHPEVGSVGAVQADAAAQGLIARTIEHEHLDRAIAEGATGGYTQLLVDKRGRVRGATIVGPRAGESLGEVSLAISRGLTTSDIASTTHAYPTFSDAVWNAAVADVRARLNQGATKVATNALRRLRRWRLR